MKNKEKTNEIVEFNFPAGKEISHKYIVQQKLGAGYEGEVYRIVEKKTGIERAAKFFFPQRNKKGKAAIKYAKLLHELSWCDLVIHYHTHEEIFFRGQSIACLISEYVDGQILTDFLAKQPGKRVGVTRGLLLLHALVSGLESMHNVNIVHGDLHANNVIVQPYGVGFELKLLDMYDWGSEQRVTKINDVYDSIKLFYDALGGAKHYAKLPLEIKQICLGMKRSLITKKFRSAAALRDHIENIDWESNYRE
tara:strand:+ start:117181 stop:117933 length:753 start_codon:yes stop_codon:yes gene_type:complete